MDFGQGENKPYEGMFNLSTQSSYRPDRYLTGVAICERV